VPGEEYIREGGVNKPASKTRPGSKAALGLTCPLP